MASSLGVYNSSVTPASLPWNTYNYCNAPHVNAKHYSRPSQAKGAKLVYLNVVQRHHKRTPDNVYPNEESLNLIPWDCSDYKQFNYGVGIPNSAQIDPVPIYHKIHTPSWHPLRSLLWNGTCDKGQLTAAGLRDSIKHGRDFYSVYGPEGVNPLLERGINQKHVFFRTSNTDRAYQVSGGLLAGMGYDREFPVYTQPAILDSIVPNYSCSYANLLRKEYQELPAWKDHLAGKQHLFASLNEVVGTTLNSDWNSWIDHHFDALASRQCHSHPLPRNPKNGKQITQELANQAYAEGDWEYNYIWNSAIRADDYVRYSFGVFVQEIAENLKAFRQGKEHFKLKYYVGHDGTMVRLFKSLAQKGQIRWPALGSELVIEVWRKNHQHYVRILQYGETMATNADLLASGQKGEEHLISWTPLDKVIEYLEKRVPSDLASKCLNGA